MGKRAGASKSLRKRKLATGPTTLPLSTCDGFITVWETDSGGMFTEPVQRPDADGNKVTLVVTLDQSHYKLLEVLFDDVASYIERLMRSHVQGLIKSAEHNAKEKSASTSNR